MGDIQGEYHSCKSYEKYIQRIQEQRKYVYWKVNEFKMNRNERALAATRRKYDTARPKIKMGGYALLEKKSQRVKDNEANSSKWRMRYEPELYVVESIIAPNVYRLFSAALGTWKDVVVERIKPIQLRRPQLGTQPVRENTSCKQIDGKSHLFVKFKQETPGIIFMDQWIPEDEIDKIEVRKYWTAQRSVAR